MKKLRIILYCLCFINLTSAAQVPIGDAVLRGKLQTLFPGCWDTNGFLDTTCGAITSVRALDLQGSGTGGTGNIMSMWGLQYFDSLRDLNIANNSISGLVLPPMLETLICNSQTNTGLGSWTVLTIEAGGLPTGLRYLNCNSNRGINGTLPAGLTWLSCTGMYYHSLMYGTNVPTQTTLPVLPSTLRYLDCSNNILSSLPALPPSLEYLNCSNNKYDDDWSGSNLHYPGIGVIPPLPATLIDLSVAYNNISEVPALPAALRYLNVSKNPLNCLPTLPASLGGQSPYNTQPYNLYTSLTNITCLRNNVIGIRPEIVLPVCDQTNDPHGCGPFPYIAAGPDVSGLSAVAGAPSSSAQYIVSAHDLNPVTGNISVTASTFFEVSTDNTNFSTSVLIPYSTSTLSNTVVYVRISSTATAGWATGTITHSGGGADDVIVSVNGTVTSNAAYILAGPPINGLASVPGSASASKTYNLSAYNLVPAAGNITITASALLEISTNNISFSSSAVTIPYTGGQLTPRNIYVRLSSSAVSGAVSGTITNSGGSATDGVVPVNGNVARFYYNSKANLGLNTPGTWSTTVDGSGPSPTSINEGHQLFKIIDANNVGYSGVFDVSAINSKIIVGDGINPVTFTIAPGADSVTSSTKIDVLNNATLKILNNKLPVFDLLADGSTVDFAQTGTSVNDEIRVPNLSYYNLKLTNGIKTLYSDPTVRNDFVASAAQTGGWRGYDSKVNCFGNVSFLSGTSNYNYNGTPSLMTLKMNGPGPVQNLITDGVVMKLHSLQRDSLSANNIILSSGLTLELNKALDLRSANAMLSSTGGKISFLKDARIAPTSFGKINCSGTSFEFTGNNSNVRGFMYFMPNATIKNFKVDFGSSYVGNGFLTLMDNVDVTDSLILNRGRIVVYPNRVLNLTSTAIISGGNTLSYVDGALGRSGNSNLLFPVGNGYKIYRPVSMGFIPANPGGTYTVQYTNAGYGNYTVDPATLSQHPAYYVSKYEYWNITPSSAGTVDSIAFNYTDVNSHIVIPSALRITHFDGSDWDDLAGIPDPLNSITNGKVTVTGISTFSPFTFAAINSAVIPVQLSNFSVKKQNTTVQIYWTSEQELNSKSFIVERSSDQNKWDAIATVNAAGNSTEKINYSATDFNPAKGINYYRLKQVDVDDRSSYSEIRSVYFGTDVKVVIAPNPANGRVTVYLPGNKEFVSIRIYDMNGRLLKTISSNEETVQVNLANISKGIYSIKITGRSINEVRKVVVN